MRGVLVEDETESRAAKGRRGRASAHDQYYIHPIEQRVVRRVVSRPR